MKKNRFLVFLLALVMMMTAAVPGLAEGETATEGHTPETFVSRDFTYILLEDGTAEIVGFEETSKNSEDGIVSIPDTLEGYTVSSICDNPFFSYCSLAGCSVSVEN